uniref:Uncharacterized protein n=1 Tax=Cyanothece sp. (strain PCC 7425 / ATCC 29141) TaxID=395961 RepID=B8HUD1_CYAP4
MNDENLKHFPRSDSTEGALADKPTQVRLPIPIAAAIDQLGRQKTPWLRRVLIEAVQRELLNQKVEV